MSELLKQINSLAVFGGLRQKEPLKSLCVFLRSTETPGTRLDERPEKISRLMEVEVDRELEILTKIGNTSYIDLQNFFYYEGHIAQFKTTGMDMKKRYLAYLSPDD